MTMALLSKKLRLDFALKMYSKYRSNLAGKLNLLKSDRLFGWGEDRDLLLSEISEVDLGEFTQFLKRVTAKLDNTRVKLQT